MNNYLNLISIYVIFFLMFDHLAYGIDYKTIEWNEIENRDGVIVFAAEHAHKESGLIPMRAITTFPHPISKILSVIGNAPKKVEWVPHMEESFTVEKIDDYSRIEYARYSSPWPFLDRTFVVLMKGVREEKSKTLTIDMESIEHKKIPLNPDHVRGMAYFGRVQLTQISPGDTKFEIIFVNDFKGNVPTWIINLVQRKWPRKMIDRLRNQLNQKDIAILPEYSKADF